MVGDGICFFLTIALPNLHTLKYAFLLLDIVQTPGNLRGPPWGCREGVSTEGVGVPLAGEESVGVGQPRVLLLLIPQLSGDGGAADAGCRREEGCVCLNRNKPLAFIQWGSE